MAVESPKPLRVLVLDGQYCHALTAIRSLGRRGIEVTVAAHKPHAMGFKSRYARKTLQCPASNTEPREFADWLLETLRRGRYDATLFFGEAEPLSNIARIGCN